ncbi:MAG TPA: BrnT family toxin [Bryobacteraceae bacterium]
MAFEEAATVFLDPFAMTFPDTDHSLEEHREITIGCTIKGA